MSRVDKPDQLGFDPARATRARTLRSEITERVPSETISPDLAPLWNELLDRTDVFAGRPTTTLAPRPPDPSLSDPLRAARVLRDSSTRLNTLAREQPDLPGIADLARVVDEHVALLTELAARAHGRGSET